MSLILKIVIVILVLLAVSSGVTKIMLMPQDVEFFGAYGFSNPMLIAFGLAQFVGGVMMVIPKSRMYGAVIVAITFLTSLVLLVLVGNYPVAGVTALATVLLGWVAKSSRNI